MVQLALEMIACLDASYFSWFTPTTTVMSSPFAGALMITFLAPAVMWPLAFSASVKRPVDSMTRSTPSAFQGEGGGALLHGQALDLVAVDDEDVVLRHVGARLLAGNLALEAALGGVVLHQVGQVVGADQVVHRDDVDLFAQESLLDDGPKNQTADPPNPLIPILTAIVRTPV